MEALYTVLTVLHWAGLAAIILGYLMNMAAKAPGPIMVWGARIQLLLGLALVGLGEASLDKEYDHAKIGVKLVVALVVVACCEISAARARKGGDGSTLKHVAAGATFVNVLVAMWW